MKYTFVFLVLGLVAAALSTPVDDTFTTKFDKINVDEVLHNDRLLNNYVSCLLEKGNCSPEGKALKDAIPDALTNDCSKCSVKQKEGAEKVVKFLWKNKKSDYEELKKKYDPSGIYEKKYEAKLKA
uniref:Uncharacterized protein n=1 Tax=Clastoptera arizonana TaxID=38151 RepID=A0A1B6CT51_9HEMI